MPPLLRTLIVRGPQGAGKATTTGSVLFKFDAIDLPTMERFQRSGIQAYDDAARDLKQRGELHFRTQGFHFNILDEGEKEADCYLVVLPADIDVPIAEDGNAAYLTTGVEKTIVLINKMDKIDWSEEKFDHIVEEVQKFNKFSVIIPVSATRGDNLLEKSSKCTWYKGWQRNNATGVTLLDALDASL